MKYDQILTYLAIVFGLLAVIMIVYGAIKKGVRKRISFMGLVIDVNLHGKNNMDDQLSPAKEVHAKMDSLETRQSEKIVKLVLLQASFSYWISMSFAIILGLSIIIGYYYNPEKASQINNAPLVICEVINSLFFFWLNKMQKRMMDCYNKIREDKGKMDARSVFEDSNGNLNKFNIVRLRYSYNGVTVDAESNRSAVDTDGKEPSHKSPDMSQKKMAEASEQEGEAPIAGSSAGVNPQRTGEAGLEGV
jgi:hypothetical protein